jgi:hypothetical protein
LRTFNARRRATQAAAEYERVAAESTTPRARGSGRSPATCRTHSNDRALAVYSRYVEQFRSPSRPSTRGSRWLRSSRRPVKRRVHEQLVYIVVPTPMPAANAPMSPGCRAFRPDIGRTLYERFADLTATTVRRELARQAPGDGCGNHGLQRSRRLRSRRSHRGGDVLSGRDLSNFSRSLVESERPVGLAAAMQDYEDAIEEEAFLFEER